MQLNPKIFLFPYVVNWVTMTKFIALCQMVLAFTQDIVEMRYMRTSREKGNLLLYMANGDEHTTGARWQHAFPIIYGEGV